MSYEQVQEAWTLVDAATEFAKKLGRTAEPAEYWQAVFAASPLVDVARTQAEGGSPLARIFLKSPYGLQYRQDHKDWIPFRHGPVTLPPLPNL